MTSESKQLVYLDWETHSECDIKLRGSWLYAWHPSTDIMCGTFGAPGDLELIRYPHLALCEKLRRFALNPSVTFVAHNAGFEQAIWAAIMVARLGYPPLPSERWKCTMAKAHCLGLPGSLKDLAPALGAKCRKDDEGHKLMLKLSKPRHGGRKNTPKWWTEEDAPEAFARLYIYNEQDVNTMIECDNLMRDLTEREQRAWIMDQRINQTGIRIDRKCVEAAIRLKDEYEIEVKRRFQETTELDSPTQAVALLAWLRKYIEIPNLQAATVVKILSRGGLPRNVRTALVCRQEMSKSSLAKLQAFLNRIDAKDIMRDNYIYHSAHTGRWTSVGAQIANLPRPGEISVNTICEAILQCG